MKKENRYWLECIGIYILSALILWVFLGVPSGYPADTTIELKVSKVYDGDTIEVLMPQMAPPLNKMSVRLYGIDTPEMHGLCSAEIAKAKQAKAMLTSLVGNNGTITVTDFKWDKYGGRIDGKVWVNGVNLSDQMVSAGLARPYFGDKKQGWCQ